MPPSMRPPPLLEDFVRAQSSYSNVSRVRVGHFPNATSGPDTPQLADATRPTSVTSVYAPQILTAPCHPVGPCDPDRPDQALTSDWPLMNDGGVEIGVWECTPGTWSEPNGEFDEMMFIASGRVTVQPTDGPSLDIAPGTLWVTPRNWHSTWTVHQTVRKLYVIDNRSGGRAPAAYLTNAHLMELGEPRPREPLPRGPG